MLKLKSVKHATSVFCGGGLNKTSRKKDVALKPQKRVDNRKVLPKEPVTLVSREFHGEFGWVLINICSKKELLKKQNIHVERKHQFCITSQFLQVSYILSDQIQWPCWATWPSSVRFVRQSPRECTVWCWVMAKAIPNTAGATGMLNKSSNNHGVQQIEMKSPIARNISKPGMGTAIFVRFIGVRLDKKLNPTGHRTTEGLTT